MTTALLPAGLRDLLPPDSLAEARLVQSVTRTLATQGYELVKPPLVEFEETLLSGSGQSLARQTFRLMDPLSQQMMAFRRDMTLQIARIAGSRLASQPRPLRLAYCGEVLRVSGTQLFPERQFCQIGAELIGADTPEADAEIVLLAAECLGQAGIEGVSIDLNLPTFVPRLLALSGFSGDAAAALAEAIERRDLTAVGRLAGSASPVFERLIAASGEVDAALAALDAAGLPPEIQPFLARLARTVELIRAEMPVLMLTLDPVERRGFEYHTALSFTVFVAGIGEVGRGGRYLTGKGELATGLTVLAESLLPAMPPGDAPRKVYLASDTPAEAARELRERGFTTLRALGPGDLQDEAARLGCGYWWDGELREVSGNA